MRNKKAQSRNKLKLKESQKNNKMRRWVFETISRIIHALLYGSFQVTLVIDSSLMKSGILQRNDYFPLDLQYMIISKLDQDFSSSGELTGVTAWRGKLVKALASFHGFWVSEKLREGIPS